MVLGDCFLALVRGDADDIDAVIDARVGAIRLAEFVNVMIGANTKR